MGPARFATALILMLLSCLAYPSKGQTDSLTLVVAIAEAEHIGKYPQALREATRVHQLAVVSSCSSCKVSSFILMGKVHWKDGRYGPSIGYFKKALEFVQSADSGSVKSTIFSYVALNFYYQGYYDSALYYFHKSLDILNNGKDKQKLPKVLNQIAVMYHRKGDYHKSVEYLFEMERVLGESGEDRDVVEVEYWGGMEGLFMDTVYFNEKITETLRQLSYRLAKKETNDLYLIYMNLGRAHDQLNHKLKAARFYKKACDLMEKQNLTPFWNDVGAGYRDANRKDSSFHFYYKYKSKFYSSVSSPLLGQV